MRSSRRKNWFFKRVALGFAVAALAAPVAQAKVDEGSSVQPTGYQAFVTDLPPAGQIVDASAYGMPRAMPTDYAISNGDQFQVVRTKPRSFGEPQVVAAGFDWKDGAIGAGLALGLVLLGAGAAAATRHLRREQTA